MTELIISQVVNGLVLGFLYVLIAIGLSIIFGMLGVVNFAHGVYFALGAYFALTAARQLRSVGNRAGAARRRHYRHADRDDV